jgi:hypothetical protein
MSQMTPFDPNPEDFARQLAEQQHRRMLEARSVIYSVHSRTGTLARFLQRLADAIDPTGQARQGMR